MDKDNLKLRLAQAQADLSGTLKDMGNSEKYSHVKEALDKLPANRLINAAQYLEKNILPAVERRSGKDSADHKFFQECISLLLMSISLHDSMKVMQSMHVNLRIDNELLRERVFLYEQYIQQYMAVEDIWFADALEHMEKGIRARVMEMLGRKKP